MIMKAAVDHETQVGKQTTLWVYNRVDIRKKQYKWTASACRHLQAFVLRLASTMRPSGYRWDPC